MRNDDQGMEKATDMHRALPLAQGEEIQLMPSKGCGEEPIRPLQRLSLFVSIDSVCHEDDMMSMMVVAVLLLS